MSETMHNEDTINFTLNGEQVSATNGENLIEA